jgi:hypothetical protein
MRVAHPQAGKRKVRPLLIALAVLMLMGGCLRSEAGIYVVSQTSPDDEEYAIYSAAIIGMYLHDGGKAGDPKGRGLIDEPVELVVISRDTFSLKTPNETLEQRLAVWREARILDGSTIESFKNNAREPVKLRRRFALPVAYVLVTNRELTEAFSHDQPETEWEPFYKAYPKSRGYLWLSRPGLNSNRDQALLYIAGRCGVLCGSGYYVMLTKINGAWEIGRKDFIWAI